ncbi:ABC transporter ATP-binding protein [Microbacterium sp. MMO-10]|uniref:ABC transporter ATP-binding protein n=1 Tax=Microbacterium sp. MMO-10 TaxID=3081272 RepID=UPI003017EBC3
MTDQNHASLRRRLVEFVRLAGVASWGWLVVAIFGAIVLAALDMLGVAAMVPLMTLFTGADPNSGSTAIFVRLFGIDDVATLTLLIAGFVAMLFVLKSACTIPFRWWLLGRTTRISADAATELMRRYVLSPFAAHRVRSLPEIYRNIGDATTASASVLLNIVTVTSDLLVMVGILGVLLFASPLVTLFTLAFFGLVVGGTQRALRRSQARLGETLADASLRTWQFLLPSFDGFREARLSSSGGAFVQGYGEARHASAQASRTITLISELPKYILEIAFVIAIAGIAGILFATGPKEQALTVLGVFAAASLRALPTLNRVTATFATVRSSQWGLNVLHEAVAELSTEPTHDEIPVVAGGYDGDIRLESLTFRYPDADEDIVQGIDLTIAQSTTMAFVGSSGAGKSTVLDLILGLLSPTRGAVTCGGRPIGEDLAGWYSGLGVVPQDVFLLNSTLAENIAFGEPAADVDLDRVTEVLRLAELYDFVTELPDGVQTVVGERGVRLSGGQRQRIGLARALYRRPKVLVLDEATSALDNETEHQIANTLQRLSGKLTLIIVAHRLSTVRRADHLVFLEDGRIAAQGTFDQVRKSNEHFARLVELGELN